MKKIKKLALFISFIFISVHIFAQITLPYSESFETDFGDWTQVTSDDFDWTRQSGSTPTPNTGPTSAQNGSWYLYIESTGHYNQQATIEAEFDFTGTEMPVFSFYYHMYGDSGMGNLFFLVNDDAGDNNDGVTGWNEVWNNFNNQGDQWNNQKICLGIYAGEDNVKIRIKAQTLSNELSDIAIDNIEVSDFSIVSVTHNNVTCGGYADGDITITVSGGFSPYDYSINDGANYTTDASTTHVFSGLSGADYPIRVRDDAGCVNRGVIETVDEPTIPNISIDKTDVVPCPNDMNGTITIAATGTNSPFEYSITGAAPFQASNTFTNLNVGTYQIAVKNTLGCIADGGDIDINAPSEIMIFETETTDVSTCFGDENGTITVTAGGGNGQLEYSIDNGTTFFDYFFFNNLAAGTYQIIIRDAQGCTKTTGNLIINQPTEVVFTSINHTDVTGCYGDENGTITLAGTGGTGVYTYSINGVSYQSSGSFTGLAADSYHVYVKDENGCTTDGGEIIISQPDLLLIDAVHQTNVQGCNGNANGEIIIDAHGGTPAIQYSIDNGATTQSGNTFSGLDVGTYYPYIEDAENCTDTYYEITITQPTQLQIDNVTHSDVTTCFNGNNGEIHIFASQGSLPLQYSIDGGTTFQAGYSFYGLTAGIYNIVVKDDNDCPVTGATITITQPDIITITDEIYTNVSCNSANDGTIYVNATGGTGDLYYSVDNGNNFPYSNGYVSSHSAGTYNIVVRDYNGCEVIGSTIIITQPDALIYESIDVQNIDDCYGNETGSITINASGGTSPYLYSLDNGFNKQASNFFDNLPAGTNYYPYIEDVNGCFTMHTPITIVQPSLLYIANQSHTNVDTCHGVPEGTITINALGGIPPYYYSIDDGANYYANGGIFTNLYAGEYIIKIHDENDCPADGYTEIIYQPDTLLLDSIKTNDIICNGQSNAQIQIFASGGQPQLKYSIDGGTVFLTTYQFFGLGPGNYQIIVKDGYDCRLDSLINILEPDELVLDNVEYTDIETCYGDNSGTVTVTAHGGGSAIEYQCTKIPSGPTVIQTTNFFENLYAGSYYIRIIDDNDCNVTSDAFTIEQPSPVQLVSKIPTDITCNGLFDGTITLIASGGVGEFEYSINNGMSWEANGGIYTNLSAGEYIVGARDLNHCEVPYFETLIIEEPPQILITNTNGYNISCNNYKDGKIIIHATGGIGDYEYSLNNGEFQESNTFENLSVGDYFAIVKDGNGCTDQGEIVTITMPPNYSTFTVTTDIGCSPLSVEFIKDFDSAIFEWDFGDDTTSNFQYPTHVYFNYTNAPIQYTVTAISYKGVCTDTSEQTITVFPQPFLQFTVEEDTLLYPDTIITIINNTPGFSNYYWDFGDGAFGNTANPLQHIYPDCGTYIIRMGAENNWNCTDTVEQTVVIMPLLPEASFLISKEKGCMPLQTIFSNISSNAESHIWDFGDGNFSEDDNPTHTYDTAGTYIVTLKLFGNCDTKDSLTKIIRVYPSPFADFTVEPDTVSVNQVVGFFDESTGSVFYMWQFSDSTATTEQSPVKTFSEPGFYDVLQIVTSENGCIDSLFKKDALYVVENQFFRYPTAFTPNNDNLNDYFEPYYNLVTECKVTIYNRHSQVVFYTEDPLNDFWDGKNLNGRDCLPDAYVWKATGKFIDRTIFIEAGFVTIIR